MGTLIRGDSGSAAGQSAAQVTAAVTATGLDPAGVGYAAWNIPPWDCGSATGALTTGTIYGLKVPTGGLAALAALALQIGVVGATLSGSKIGVYDIQASNTGTKLGEIAADTAFTTAIWNDLPFVISSGLTPYVYVALLAVGTTGPGLLRSPNSTSGQLAMGQTNTKNMPTCLLGGLTAQSALPSTINYASNSNNNFVSTIALR